MIMFTLCYFRLTKKNVNVQIAIVNTNLFEMKATQFQNHNYYYG